MVKYYFVEEEKPEIKLDEKPILIKTDEKPAKKPKKSKKDIKIKTDNFRTGISNITGISKRGKPPVLKQELIEFLESHELIQTPNKTWFWIEIKKEMI